MAQVIYSPGIEIIKGALDTEHKLINRQKHLHDTVGTLTKECKPEIYLQRNKRDYTQTPPTNSLICSILERQLSALNSLSTPTNFRTLPRTTSANSSSSIAVALSPNSKVPRISKRRWTKKAVRSTISASIISFGR